MTDVLSDVEDTVVVATVLVDEVVDGRLVEQLVGRAREQGLLSKSQGQRLPVPDWILYPQR